MGKKVIQHITGQKDQNVADPYNIIAAGCQRTPVSPGKYVAQDHDGVAQLQSQQRISAPGVQMTHGVQEQRGDEAEQAAPQLKGNMK